MIRTILKLGDLGLQQRASEVLTITAEISTLIDDMIETMHQAPGIGLAAPQVGVSLRIFVVDLSVGRERAALMTFVNPVLVERDGVQRQDEGCLSVPGCTATVARPRRVVVRSTDRHGRVQQIEGVGLLARAFQHETDHLDGTLFLDRLWRWRRYRITRKIARLTQQGRW